jgi:hypothetical protein
LGRKPAVRSQFLVAGAEDNTDLDGDGRDDALTNSEVRISPEPNVGPA